MSLTNAEILAKYPLPPGYTIAQVKEYSLRHLARKRFLDFVTYTKPDYVVEPVHRYVAGKLQEFVERCERQERPRLILQMPPQHGKSTLSSRHLPAWILGRNPKWRVALVSYNADWAADLGRDARDVFTSEQYQNLWPQLKLADDRTAGDDWRLSARSGGGGMLSVGRDGGITGRPAHVLIFDDLIKNRGEAYSDHIRKQIKQDMGPNFVTRLQHGAGILAVATPWHYDDPLGFLKSLENEGFEVINLEALSPGELDPLGRPEGEPLAPNLHDLADLDKLHYGGTLSESDWQALYCGRPTAASGAIFKSEWLERNQENDPHNPGWVFQAVDTAFSEKRTADFTVVSTWRVERNCYRLLHVARARLTFPDLKTQLPQLAGVWNPIVVLVEDIGSGKSLAQELKAETRLPIVEWKPDRDKRLRANSVTGLFAADKVKLPIREPWLRDWVAEHLQFPAGAHDDQVDTTTMALTWARENEPKIGPTTQQHHDFTFDADMAKPKTGWRSSFEDAQQAAYEAVAAVQGGNLVACTQQQYRTAVRLALQAQAGEWTDEGQDVYAQIALMEIQRLDKLHAFA